VGYFLPEPWEAVIDYVGTFTLHPSILDFFGLWRLRSRTTFTALGLVLAYDPR